MAKLLKVNEIFSSLQGEGKYTGVPTTFVRLHGCNMLCTYCDTLYAVTGKKFRKAGVEKIKREVGYFGNRNVCITGGEPLSQEMTLALVYELQYAGHTVSIETNGGVPLPDTSKLRSFNYVMDIKCPSSAMTDLNVYGNLSKLTTRDEVKFVIADRVDFEFALDVIRTYPTYAPIIFSPLFTGRNSNIMQDLADWVENEKVPNARLGVQLHKILGVD